MDKSDNSKLSQSEDQSEKMTVNAAIFCPKTGNFRITVIAHPIGKAAAKIAEEAKKSD